MKKSHKGTIAAVCTAVVVFNFSSCKYPEGPKFTLKSKKSRLVGEWEVTELAGESTGGAEFIMEFDDDGEGKFTTSYSYYGYSYSYSTDFEWEWADNKASLEIDIEDGDTYEFEILKLTKDEMILEDEDGEEWELEKQD
ncbi:hypothetical protein GYB22_10965 [bacterium]|nr:hypothetical protein [bacterium]